MILRNFLDPPGEARMSLGQHLQELRSRLIRCVLAVLILGGASLFFSRAIFGLLMRPVLDALPPESRSLIYTSGIEEINVLMKVGLYSGLFLTTPVILWQLWGFVAPGLYPTERKFAGPFVLLGTLAFVGGAFFCYRAILPSMFDFLLNSGDSYALVQRLNVAQSREQDALRFLRLGNTQRAGQLAKTTVTDLHAGGDGKIDASNNAAPNEREVSARLDALGRIVDAVSLAWGPQARPQLAQVMEKRLAAQNALSNKSIGDASTALEEAARALSGVDASNTGDFGEIWTLEKELAYGKSRFDEQRWTKPMLTMREQLSLVLMLELAFGVIFELPLVLALLTQLGVIKASWLIKYQRHAFVMCLILAAVITPTGDAVNLALMAGPMLLCYEVGVLASWLIEKRKARMASNAIVPTP